MWDPRSQGLHMPKFELNITDSFPEHQHQFTSSPVFYEMYSCGIQHERTSTRGHCAYWRRYFILRLVHCLAWLVMIRICLNRIIQSWLGRKRSNKTCHSRTPQFSFLSNGGIYSDCLDCWEGYMHSGWWPLAVQLFTCRGIDGSHGYWCDFPNASTYEQHRPLKRIHLSPTISYYVYNILWSKSPQSPLLCPSTPSGTLLPNMTPSWFCFVLFCFNPLGLTRIAFICMGVVLFTGPKTTFHCGSFFRWFKKTLIFTSKEEKDKETHCPGTDNATPDD